MRSVEIPRGSHLEVGWSYLAGVAAGGLAGLLVGGVGGRLVMLLLRVTSPESVLGVKTDDGFTIGVVSLDTVGLLLGLAFIGGGFGAIYVAVRTSIPARLRIVVWPLFVAAIGGTDVIHEDGVDFQLLDPKWLAVSSFVVLLAAAAAVIVVLAERWIALERPTGRQVGFIVACGLVGTFGLMIGAAFAAVSLVWRRVPLRVRRPLGAGLRVAVLVALVAVTVIKGVDLAQTAAAIV